VKVDLLKEREVEPHNLAAELVLQLSTGARFNVLLVAAAPVDVFVSDHR